MDEKNVLVMGFARLWGQTETFNGSNKDIAIAKEMKAYDDLEMCELLENWADEYLSSDEGEDFSDFFYRKVETLVD